MYKKDTVKHQLMISGELKIKLFRIYPGIEQKY